MAGYHERLRDLDNTRWLMRDFLIHGFRTRSEQKLSSARTYDNERHRIESLLGDVLSQRQGEGGREYFIAADVSALDANPLHKIYRLRSFTDNDLMLHCCLLSLLDRENGLTADELTDAIASETDFPADVQAVRRKLLEYTALGIVHEQKDGKRKRYTLSATDLATLFPQDTGVAECLSFFREALPMGSLADGIMLRHGDRNRFIRFKHHFLMHTLDDDLMQELLVAIHAEQAVKLLVESRKEDARPHEMHLLPVCIRISEETGRRFLVGYDLNRRFARAVRLDSIPSLTAVEPPEDAPDCIQRVWEELANCWGISLYGSAKTYHVRMDVRISLPQEDFVLDRLQREGRGGSVTQIGSELFRYEIDVSDPLEMMRWIRTFTGRIVALEDESGQADSRFREDMERLRKLYATEVNELGTV